MNEAGAALLGEHDFLGFCRPREGATTIRTLLTLRAERDSEGTLVFRVEADAFCHSMVRSLVGALLLVGQRARDIDYPARILRARSRSRADECRGRGYQLPLLFDLPDGEKEMGVGSYNRRPRSRCPSA